MSQKLTGQALARILADELKTWGDIDPSWIEQVARGGPDPEDGEENRDNTEAMQEVLDRVADRLSSLVEEPPCKT